MLEQLFLSKGNQIMLSLLLYRVTGQDCWLRIAAFSTFHEITQVYDCLSSILYVRMDGRCKQQAR